MKKMTTCTLKRRLSLARMTGRIMTIEAPVVPMREASTAPIARKPDIDQRRAADVARAPGCRPRW